MAIRFSCPSCQQPIEVDDNWGGQAVACPYCRRVVTAPRESTWPPGDVPVASPASGAFAPPPPPIGRPAEQVYGPPPRSTGGGVSSAGWALMLAIFAAVLAFAGTMLWWVGLYEAAIRQVGENAAPEQLRRAAQQIMMGGKAPVSPAAVTTLAVGILCGIAALALALRSFIADERHYVKAGAACLIGALIVVWQGLMVLMLLQQGGA